MVRDFDLNNFPSVEIHEFEMENPVGIDTTLDLHESQLRASLLYYEQAREVYRRNRLATELANEEVFVEYRRSNTAAPAGSSRIGGHSANVHLDAQGIAADESSAMPQIPSVSEPKKPNFICAVCIGEIVESTSTKCGHIFCKSCIDAALEFQKKCPTCRRKLKAKDTFRVYLPALNE